MGQGFESGSAPVKQSRLAERHTLPPEGPQAAERVNAALSVASATAEHPTSLTSAAGYMDAKSLAALSLAPLVAIARADGGAHDRQKSLVLSWAGDAGLREGESAYHLVQRWLHTPSTLELLAAWRTHYVPRLSLVLTPEAKRALKLEIWNRARALVEATGAFSGIGQWPSREEQAVMDEIDAALS